MSDLVAWLEAHDKLAGWAQFFGAVLALGVTYMTAFAPTWRRRQQLRSTATRLLLNGVEVVESYHRTSANFVPFSLSAHTAALTMSAVADDINRFPIFELDDQGPYSVARRLTSMSTMLKTNSLYLDDFAKKIDGRFADDEERYILKLMLDDQLKMVIGLATGAKLERPVWPADEIEPMKADASQTS
ncbi:hypothetical protein [Caulobacter sp. RHG1]|uniref:hypothetical protein n=1 Tax=Caulobacter sp. (strain RHG1) TaxID=2545762 RepID=UPI0015562C3D|nr:hypothetical protein [Caulobacter sp. RHG1]